MGLGNITHNTISNPAGNQNAYTNDISGTNGGGIAKSGSLQELTPGKVFSGEVVSVNKEKVVLKLENGQTIQASATSDIKLTEGQKVAFMVKSNNGKQLAIKPMFDVPVNNSSVLKALENAGIPVNAKNAELINRLMQEQMPIDKDTVLRFLRQMNLNPEVGVKTLVDLQKMGQPATPENIARFEGYQNHQYQLATEIASTATEMAEFIAKGTNAEGIQGLEPFSRMMDILFPKGEETLEFFSQLSETTNGSKKGELQGVPVLYDNLKSETMLQGASQGLTELQRQALENLEVVTGRFQGQEVEMEHILQGLKVLNDEAERILSEVKDTVNYGNATQGKGDMMSRLFAAFEMYEAAEKSMEQAKTVLGGEEYQLLSEEMQKDGKAGNQLDITNNDLLKGILDETGRNVLAQKVYKITGDISQYFQVRSGEMSPQELVRMINDMIPKEVSLAENTMQEITGQQVAQELGKEGNVSQPGAEKAQQPGNQGTISGEVTKASQQPEMIPLGKTNQSQGEQMVQFGGGSTETTSAQEATQPLQPEMEHQAELSQTIKEQALQQGTDNTKTPSQQVAEKGQQSGINNLGTTSQQVPEKAQQWGAGSTETISQSVAEQVQQSGKGSKETVFQPTSEKTNTSVFQENVTQTASKEPVMHKQPEQKPGETMAAQQLENNKANTRMLNEALLEKVPELKELLQSDEFKEVVRKAVENKLLLSPEKLTKENVKEYYEKLDSQIEKLNKFVSEMGKQDSGILKNTTSLRQNVDYMNQLNQLYSYVQIPLKLGTQNANSELYVMTNKKKNREHNDGFTALLHLDMEKLGSIDVYITMEQKKVAARFYLEKDSTAAFLRENHQPFVERLQEKGFQITAEFEKKPPEKNMVEEFTDGKVKEAFANQYSFDIRT